MLTTASIQTLQSRLHGALIRPEDAAYDSARAVYNGLIERHPRLIVRCADAADVCAAVDFARRHALPLAVRGGGHSGAGLGVCDDGLVIDLARLRTIQIDPQTRSVRVGGGCSWGELDRASHAHGLATPGAIVASTGVGGLTLGGGVGHLTRKYGLSSDNLLAVEMVLADGRRVRAGAAEHPELFWAVRGGGGNFGVVTTFVFRLHPLTTVVAGPTLWPIGQAAEVLRWYRSFITSAPQELNGLFVFLRVPSAAPFPAALHRRTVCGVIWCYCGPSQRAEALLAPVRRFARPLLHAVRTMPYPALQSAFDSLYRPGLQWYWQGDFIRELSDAAIALHVENAARLPTPLSSVHLYPLDGAVHSIGAEASAFGWRDVNWAVAIVGVDPEPASRPLLSRWVRSYWQALRPCSAGGAYVNFMMDEGRQRVMASYRDNYPRLAAIKRRYDPGNLFRVNQNIPPGGPVSEPAILS